MMILTAGSAHAEPVGIQDLVLTDEQGVTDAQIKKMYTPWVGNYPDQIHDSNYPAQLHDANYPDQLHSGNYPSQLHDSNYPDQLHGGMPSDGENSLMQVPLPEIQL